VTQSPGARDEGTPHGHWRRNPPPVTVALPAAQALPAAAAGQPVEPAIGTETGQNAAVERRILIDLLIYAWDRARSAGVLERLTSGLAQVGVEVIRPDGELFNPEEHEVGGVESTSDPLLHNTIAETESAGFRDRDRLIREPVVVVYRRQ
jgi:molecular chaperone GrpE